MRESGCRAGNQIVLVLPYGGISHGVDSEVLTGLPERTDAILTIMLQVCDIRSNRVCGASAEAVQWEMIVEGNLNRQEEEDDEREGRRGIRSHVSRDVFHGIGWKKGKEKKIAEKDALIRKKSSDQEIKSQTIMTIRSGGGRQTRQSTHHSLRVVEAFDVLARLCVVL